MLQVHNKMFWELPEEIYDEVNDAGLRGHYLTCRRAAQLMVPRRDGLIITVSSPGGLCYVFNVAYGLNKAGVSGFTAFFQVSTLRNDLCEILSICFLKMTSFCRRFENDIILQIMTGVLIHKVGSECYEKSNGILTSCGYVRLAIKKNIEK